MRTLAEERRHSVVAGGAVRARRAGAVIDVLAAVVSRPAVHADAVEPADGVMARSSVLTRVRGEFTLIDVRRTVLTGPMFVTVAVVSVDPVYAFAAILTGMLGAVINIVFTGLTSKPWQTGAGVRDITGL